MSPHKEEFLWILRALKNSGFKQVRKYSNCWYLQQATLIHFNSIIMANLQKSAPQAFKKYFIFRWCSTANLQPTKPQVGSMLVLPLPGLMAKLILSEVEVICTPFLLSHHSPLESLFYLFLPSRSGHKILSSTLASVLNLATSGDGVNSEELVTHCPGSSQDLNFLIFAAFMPALQGQLGLGQITWRPGS